MSDYKQAITRARREEARNAAIFEQARQNRQARRGRR